MARIICFLFALTSTLAEAKVSICAHYFGQPEFIKYQYLFFKKNMLDDYEFIVFEDSNDLNTSKKIKQECEKYDIPYVHIPRTAFEQPKLPVKDWYISLNAPSFQCCVATQYIYDNYVTDSENICLILDNDIFLLSPFSIEKHLGNHSFSYPREDKRGPGKPVFYMLPNFLILNPKIMPEKEKLDFNMGTILGTNTDSGGYTYFYLCDYSSLGIEMSKYYLYNTSSDLKNRFEEQCPLLFSSTEWASHYFIEKDTFLHIRMGSNWSRNPKYPQMVQETTTLFEALLSQSESQN